MTSSVGLSLLYTFIIDFGIQFACYVPSAILKTEKIYDLSGAVTYFSCIIVALLWRQNTIPLQNLSSRQIIAASFVLVWCSRLGYTLFLRVLRSGHDSRFDKLKSNPILFLVPWFLQAVWIFLTGTNFESSENQLIWISLSIFTQSNLNLINSILIHIFMLTLI